MKDNKKPIWITIPDETASVSVENRKLTPEDKVENKAFWATGFIALIVFTVVLVVPTQLTGLMKAQLFDGEFQVVPDFEDQGSNEFFENAESDEEGAIEAPSEIFEETVLSDNVVEAESEPVSIQIEPLEPEMEASEILGNESVVESPDPESLNEVVQAESNLAEDSADLQTLLQDLSAQIETLKQEGINKNEQIAALNEKVESGGSLFGSANDFGLPSQEIPQFVTELPNTTPKVEVKANGNVYRYNTHTVTVNPRDVLSQNRQATQSFRTHAFKANITQSAVTAYSNQNFNPVLSGVQSQPETGPAESFLFTLLLASVGVLGFGIYRSVRA